METTCGENAEGLEKLRKIRQDCFGTPTILRHVLEHCRNNELLKLSLVNKLWNFEARSVLKKRGQLRASTERRLNLEEDSCQKLTVLASNVKKMRVIPFTGLHISLVHSDGCKLFANEAWNSPFKVILDRLPWKHFSVRFCNGWRDSRSCPALLLVKRVLKDHCGELEDLTIEHGDEKFLRTIFQGQSLPCLKKLTVEKKSSGREYLTDGFIKTLVSCAPNLQQLRVEGENNFPENILEGSSAVLVVTHYRSHRVFRPLIHQVCESLVGSFRAESMEILLVEEDTDEELLKSYIPKLLEASRTSLKQLEMDLLFAVPLMCYGICLGNVTTFKLHINYWSLKELDSSILDLPTGLDFTRVFPKLTKVTIVESPDEFSSDVISEFVQRGTHLYSSALPDRASHIKFLDLRYCDTIDDTTIPYLARMFPDVETVHLSAEHEVSFEYLQFDFECLEEITTSKARLKRKRISL